MREMTCITCPNGCTLQIEEVEGILHVTGNKCKRGEAFAIAELTHPMRTICSTVWTIYPEVPVLPVRVSGEIPKERIFDVMKEINHILVDRHVRRGDVLLENVLGSGVDIIVTSNRLSREENENECETV